MKCEKCLKSTECDILKDINLGVEGFNHQLKEAGLVADVEVRIRECDPEKYQQWKDDADTSSLEIKELEESNNECEPCTSCGNKCSEG